MGIPCVSAEGEQVSQLQALLKQTPDTPVKLDLEAMQVHCGAEELNITLNQGARQMLLSGTWDSCGQLINYLPQIRTQATKIPYLEWV
jgi:3-isopropylmalate/(R)-2-methylmalate dehydratase small subunit